MKKTGFYLWMLAMLLGGVLAGCSDSDDEETPPEPGGNGDVVEPPAGPVYDTAIQYTMLNLSSMENVGRVLTTTAYNKEKRCLETFTYALRSGTKEYQVSYKQDTVIIQLKSDPAAEVATYVLDSKTGWMKEAEYKTAAATAKYRAVYTATRFELYNTASNNTPLYWGETAAGETYGNWSTAGAANHPGVTMYIKYPEKEAKNYSGLDLFFLGSFVGVEMPDCITWGYYAGLFPYGSKCFNELRYSDATATDQEWAKVNINEQNSETLTNIAADIMNMSDAAYDSGAWDCGTVNAKFEIEVYEVKAE